ncbi:hypothetical protein SETIT_9G119600v2 [Setaria italica]|uniref:DUF1618 domain-containing protein n=1 Tax=Setaria italica TaxID=4555 RepID=A0A368SFM2_SETIT|nr:hypothetical protein SETIT_9G119600v2 [Setaria italica]
MDEEEAMISMQQPHLYLIFDDWECGYSFRKVDLPSRAPALIPEGIARGGATCLPPPFFRLQAQRGLPYYFTASGSKIWSLHPNEEGKSLDSGGSCFDPVYFPIGNDKLVTLGCLSIQCLDIGVKKHPTGVALSWSDPLDVPVDSMDIISHAVFPDGRTIFVSVGFVAAECTYSFHLSDDGGSLRMCKHQGEWVLPFHGRGHFDGELNTKDWPFFRRPDVKYTEDHLFTMGPDETHVGATLVYMGHESKICLVECMINVFNDRYGGPYSFEKENTDQEKTDDYMLRLTTFSLEYSSDGDLTTGHRRVRYYKMPKNVSRRVCQYPVAFWM